MKKSLWAITALLIPVISGWAATSVTVKQSGGGDFTTIQAAIDSGASTVTIIDSAHYVEDLQIGDPITGGPPVTLTSTKSGTNRPVVTPLNGHNYTDSRRGGQNACFGVFANNSVIANLVIEANPDAPNGQMGAMVVVATNVLVESCLFRIASGTASTLGASNPLLFFGQQGDGSNTLPGVTPGGPDSNGCLARNCEFMGVAQDVVPLESTGPGYDTNSVPDGSLGYQNSPPRGTGQGSGYVRVDILTDTGEDVFITFEACYFHHDQDYGIFPTDLNTGGGSVNIVVKKCRFDANGKFQIRGRGANVFVEDSIFTRAGQIHSTDTENSAVAINNNDGHRPSGSVKNSLFVNCASAAYQQAYFGGINNDSGTFMAVDHCSFVDCLSGVSAGTSGPYSLAVSNSIFHQIGDSVPPCVDSDRVTLTNGSPELLGGLYQAWTNGMTNFVASGHKWTAVFNRWNANAAQIIIDNCMVGSIDTEDTQPWDQALTNIVGCRLYAGYDSNFVGTASVTRATPVFVNQDPDAPNAFQLAANSPGQTLGANLAPVLEPKLAFSQAGSQLTLSWTLPIWIKGYVLKGSPSLSSPVWTPVGGVTNFSVAYSVPVTIGAGNQYFAVMKQ